MPTPWQIRKRLLEVCHLAARKGYVAAYEGNFSARLPDDRILITPSRRNKGMLTSEDLVVIDQAGHPQRAELAPSSEFRLHTTIYAERSDVGAVAHGHPPYSTAFAVSHHKLCIDCMPETLVELGNIPLVPYGTPGTHELSDRLRDHLHSAQAFLLANHGAVTVGADVDEAYFRLEMLEQAARILYYAATLGGACSLDPAAKEKLSRTGNHT